MKENKEILKRKERGITLIALVITIIVLLILAGVSIAMLTGENGILTQAQNAKNRKEEAQAEEQNILTNYEQYIEGSTNGGTLTTVTGYETTNTKVQDSLGNVITVPAGFKVVNPGDNVEDGIVIEDVSHKETAGSQFVWIPIGEIETNKGKITVNLDRYTFSEDGTKMAQGTNKVVAVGNGSDYCLELESSSNGNITAKDINTFISKTKETKGYYIGRYEARTPEKRTNVTDKLTTVTEKKDDCVYNYITQSQAADLSQNMYSDSNFTSDLINSYAWDTALVFIQEFSVDKDYSRQTSLNDELKEKGTDKDVLCNIYDMASNCGEFSTENCDASGRPCVARGGYFSNDSDLSYYSSSRNGTSKTNLNEKKSFRIILYL